VYDKKKAQENELMAWVNATPDRKAKYGELVDLLEKGYTERAKVEKASTYMQEAAFGSEVVGFGFRSFALLNQLRTDPKDAQKVGAAVARIQAAAEEFWKDYDPATDQEVTAAMFKLIDNDVDPALHPGVMKTIRTKYKGDFDAWAKVLFSTSILTDRKRLDAFLAKPTLKAMEKDPGIQAMESCLTHFRGTISQMSDAPQSDIDKGYRLMVAAMRERDPQRMWYPNANSTMRLTYGQVGSYVQMDGAFYKHVTTAKGILEKEDPTNDEFIVPTRQKELLLTKDYGRYADENGELITCFISNNDITGVAAGSPVLNAYGELIGIAFDGNWEAMSGDIAFEPDLQRTISVDIRYVLWCIDKLAGAGHLVNEMTLVERKPEVKEVAPAPVEEVVPAPAPRKNK